MEVYLKEHGYTFEGEITEEDEESVYDLEEVPNTTASTYSSVPVEDDPRRTCWGK